MDRGEAPRLSGLLADASDGDLAALVPTGTSDTGWGSSGPIDLDGTTLFAKRIPVTDRELERWPSTANHFGLPLRYQYGVGSAGFGAAREAAMWRQAAEWFAGSAVDGVPALLHQRVVPRTGGPWPIPLGREAYAAHWGGDPAIGRFMDARAAATHELWLVGEHFPHTALGWLASDQGRVDDLVDVVLAAVAVLRENGTVHFDAHLDNVVLDQSADRACLVDFGLASGPDLELDDTERAFLAAHRHYDTGVALLSVSFVLSDAYRALDEDDRARARACCEVPVDSDRHALLTGLVDHADRLAEEELVDVHPAYAAALGRYRDVILYTEQVLAAVLDPAADSGYDDDRLVSLLRDCGLEVAT